MADDLDKKMEPEISETKEKVEEVIKEEVKAVEKAEEKAQAAKKKADKATEAAAAVAASAAAEKEAAKAAEDAAKDAAKAKAAAEKEAAKAQAAAEKEAAKAQAAADKEAEKARIAKEKADAKLEKKRQKREAQQALIDACPPQYRPVSTSMYFWLTFLSAIPVIGFIITIFLSIAGRNRNVKNFEKAIFAYYLIGIIVCLIGILVLFVALSEDQRGKFLSGLSTIFGSFKLG